MPLSYHVRTGMYLFPLTILLATILFFQENLFPVPSGNSYLIDGFASYNFKYPTSRKKPDNKVQLR